ncbi:hypothetical protein RFI_16660 [Reticulomyxa filosa]|uniref:Uncharacterized protein n=1 Tax=Reticulomyxa filosa TaxID=46433 RepID=X6N3R5_RETFI|nr:hypothetical protein RFI_16660 [Reticulomyxa filosa]|eukprot:ETO20558.1 hypothetical protein RFI_16660 [Reticulomyxa filosa]
MPVKTFVTIALKALILINFKSLPIFSQVCLVLLKNYHKPIINRTPTKENKSNKKKYKLMIKKTKYPWQRKTFQTLDFKKHWSVDWIKSNVKAVKMVMEMINKGEQGLVVVAKPIDSNLNILSDNVNLSLCCIDGNVYSIDCKIQSKGNVTITTQVFVTKNVIIDQKLRQFISPIEWNNKIHHDILGEVQLAINTFRLDHPYVANAYNNLGAGCVKNGRDNDAIQYQKISLKIVLSIFGENHPWIANLYNYLGIPYDNLAQYENTIKHHKKALDIRLKTFDNNDSWIAYSYHQLGFAYGCVGHYKHQIECYEKELKIEKYIFGDSYSKIAELYKTLGFSYVND